MISEKPGRLKDSAPEVSVSGVEITPELNRIVSHCLEKNPGERFQSASDLAYHLPSLLSGAVVRQNPGRQVFADFAIPQS
jgi:hypothetical protein